MQPTATSDIKTVIESIDRLYQEKIKLLLATIEELKQERPRRIKILVHGRARWIRETNIIDVCVVEIAGESLLKVNLSSGSFTLPLHSPQALKLMDFLDVTSEDLTTK